ncbi:MAG: DNA methyltransferase [Chloroflexi bacterium]|nr:DNA methyltransferase [Chloroflexota bacterium]
MPKKKNSSQQASFFRREVPKMPEGYYSSGPNPNLRRFVEQHTTPYDLETDDYDVPPFDQPITTTKATAIYRMHTYWSKKPHDAIQRYIRHYTKSGDLVLDPFSGSGGTSLAALMEGRAAVAIDLSPAATFITKNYCTPVDVDELQRAFEQLKAKVKPEMDWLYETRCDRCDGRAITSYTVYSYVFECPRCLSKIPLFDCIEKQPKNEEGKSIKINICPFCYKNGHEERIDASCKRFDPIPVLVSYDCIDGCKPKRSERFYNDENDKKRSYFHKFDLLKIAEINNQEIPYWYPTNRMLNSSSDDNTRWGLLWRPYHSGINYVKDFYTKRNLWAVALVLNELSYLGHSIKDTLSFYLTSILYKASIMMAHNEDGAGRVQKGILYIPPIEHDINVLHFLDISHGDFIRGYEEVNKVQTTELCISTSDSKNINIEDNSVDYIFTDPPYGGAVQYGELNHIWESWLKFDTFWTKNEVIVNDFKDKSESIWENSLQAVLVECFRTLKPNRWISLCYHDSSEGTWQLIQDIMTEIGFIPETTSSTLFIDTATKTLKQLFSEKITKRDLVINFRKPREGEVAAKLQITGDEDPSSFNEKAGIILREALERTPGAPADRLYDELVSRMVRKGEFQRHNFDALLRTVAEETGGRWYLLDTVDQLDETEAKKENAAAARLETFMEKYLQAHPGEGGVHYSNLFEEYLPVSDKPRRLLQDWLPEFFFKTESGTWRPPVTEDERQVKTSLRLSGELRHIKRFANALNAGVPPAERDRPSNAATLAEWIYQCRRSGLYDLGRVLYERGGLRFDSLGDDSQMQVEEDYQICVKRGSVAEKKGKKKKEQLDLL